MDVQTHRLKVIDTRDPEGKRIAFEVEVTIRDIAEGIHFHGVDLLYDDGQGAVRRKTARL